MLTTAYSSWFILLCLAVGAGYAALLYSKKAPWSRAVNFGLAVLRFVLVSGLCWLLLGPIFRRDTTTQEAPTVVLAVDDSRSVPLYSPDSAALRGTLRGLDGLTERLRQAGYTVQLRTLDTAAPAQAAQIRFREPATNLDALLTDLQESYQGRNLAAVVLASDGLANQGRPPVYADFSYPIYPVALGDTLPRRDLRVTDLRYNRVAFAGNRFPLEAEIGYDGFPQGGTATVLLRENGRVLERRQVALSPNQRLQRTRFLLSATAPGKHRYEVVVEAQSGEFTQLNNTRNAYIEVVKGRLRVLLAGAAPHPDLKALRTALLGNDNFDVTLVLPGIEPLRAQQDYDVAILHQLPSRTGEGREVLNYVRSRHLPALFVLGAQSDLPAYNALGTGLRVAGGPGAEVSPVVNPNFTRFTLDADAQARVADYPAVPVAATDAQVGGGAEVILRQRQGRASTARPLLLVAGPAGQRQATLLTEGSWQWRLHEAATHPDERAPAYDGLVTRLLQLLTQDARRKRLDVYPTQDVFNTSDDVTLGVETYNAVFERVYDQQISLTLTDEQNRPRTFTFTNRQNGGPLRLGPLPGGVYRYTATATVAGQAQQDRGELLVQEQQLEAGAAHADHNALYQLAQRSGGRLYYPQQLQQLEQQLVQAKFKPVLYSQEELKDLIDEPWLLVLLVLLASAEWAVRRYSGSI
ncbi:VWA domain-containing protein [Hymenobacter sp. 15J16-1T3B]|uniref:VWA domain-containing protein n=1 Tax=Hymenobacter sp. 15J16-1T3B TaxID=2886941 RepID=UPI001D10C1B1|nr:VWA domain-containing protein [Hymenobacter sp. 15J16-1T3B]MCC3158288.1 VWA domain-containing protein [Hymenobacter sp. 15J16-1T3B]